MKPSSELFTSVGCAVVDQDHLQILCDQMISLMYIGSWTDSFSPFSQYSAHMLRNRTKHQCETVGKAQFTFGRSPDHVSRDTHAEHSLSLDMDKRG